MPPDDGFPVPNGTESTAKDPILEKLTQGSFDPVQYLNETLPTLSISSQGASSKQNRANQLQTSSTETQSIFSRLNTHNIQSSSELTTSTDEILRSGNRLAYEVEVLRGDANSLYELLTDTLREDIKQFVHDDPLQVTNGTTSGNEVTTGLEAAAQSTQGDPEFIRQLRALGLVKSRLEAVIHMFGEALKWPIPQSEVSMASSLISVSAPELGVANSAEDDKAREVNRKFRIEISELLDSDGGGYRGVDQATKRLEDLRNLAIVWKGTAEEKARNKVVDNLARLVDDRKRALDARNMPFRSDTDAARSSSVPGRVGTPSNATGGLFGGLRKLRDEIYLD